jgi:outer membrane protein OmpA-like peptidoglycan-associated protein
MKKLTFVLAMIAVLACVGADPASAQFTVGRWALGMHGGANYWITDYNTLKIGPGGEVFLRYGLHKYFSLGIMGGYEVLKTEQTTSLGAGNFQGYMRVTAIPAALVGTIHLYPWKAFSPYIYIGGGAMAYQRGASGGVYPLDGVWRYSYFVPAGFGFESFASSNVAFDMSVGAANIGNWIDARKSSTPNGYLTAKAGINIYFGSSDADDDDADALYNGEERKFGTDPENPDTDGDGIKDGEEVKRYRTNPLRADTDGDGLPDGEEVQKYKTIPTRMDSDGDGLSDGDEIFKNKTEPLKIDTDGDGLPDGDEVVRYKSDPLRVDSDGDGLSDWDEVKTYKTDPTNADTDGDGLMDGDEVKKYHTNPLKADTDGGSTDDGTEVKRGANPLDPRDDVPILLEKGKSLVLEGVNFETGSARLTKASEGTLDRVFIALVAHPEIRVEIAGYTDNVGSRRTNQRLSQRRADAVSEWLVKKGIAATRMTTVGRGDLDPIAPNSNPEGRAKNRRIEFRVR